MFYKYFMIFVIYSFIGFLIEVIRCLVLFKKIVNRGFLIGPLIPIYGVCSLILLYFSRFKDNFILLSIIVITTIFIVEYLTSFLMEKLFNARFWDYSSNKFNINGRVCVLNLFYFYLISLFVIYYFNDIVINIISFISIEVVIIILILFLIDLILSIILIISIKKKIKVVKKDRTEEISKIIKEILLNEKYPKKRLLKGFFLTK